MKSALPAVSALVIGLAVAAPAWSLPERLGDYVTRPSWKKQPDLKDLRRFYPREAKGASGETTASCLIDGKGEIADCTLIREWPQGLGFGDATLKLARKFRLRKLDADGQPVAGRRVSLPISWFGGYYEG